MPTTMVYWGYIGIMEKKMATTNYHSIYGLNWDNRKENGNYYTVIGIGCSLDIGQERCELSVSKPPLSTPKRAPTEQQHPACGRKPNKELQICAHCLGLISNSP